jgi:hypothetical protein
VTHGCHAERKNGSAASELRCRCAWLHHGSGPWTHRIQGCGAIDPRPKAGSPLIVIPTAPSVPSCSKLSRCGLARAEHAERLVRRPTLTAPARADVSNARVGRRNGLSDRTKKLTKERRCTALLDKKSPIQGNRAGGTYAGAALDLRGLESGAQSKRLAILNGRRPRIRAQLRRYGTDIAKWGFDLSPRV